MISDISYKFASGELLEQRNTYFYTKYEGEAFLTAWKNQRESVVNSTQTTTTPPIKRARKTFDLLVALQTSLIQDHIKSETTNTIDKFLQRFEVTKRIHGEYNQNWKPVDVSDYTNLDCYVLFAEILDKSYSLTENLKYLNGLLKIIDTLTALHHQLNKAQKNRLNILIEKETAHINLLKDKVVGFLDAQERV